MPSAGPLSAQACTCTADNMPIKHKFSYVLMNGTAAVVAKSQGERAECVACGGAMRGV